MNVREVIRIRKPMEDLLIVKDIAKSLTRSYYPSFVHLDLHLY